MYCRHIPGGKLVLFATLPQVATVLDQLHKFLGPELKAVTGESAGIDEIMDRVEGLALPLNKVILTTKSTRTGVWEGLRWGKENWGQSFFSMRTRPFKSGT